MISRSARPAGLLLFGLAAAGLLAGLDWGGRIDAGGGGRFSSSNRGVYSESLSLWLGHEFGREAELDAQASLNNNQDRRVYYDLDRLALAGRFLLDEGRAGLLSYAAGRIQVDDVTGMVYSGPIDGLRLAYAAPAFSLGLWAGYTGWQFSGLALVSMSQADYQLVAKNDQSFGPRRLVESARAAFPELFLFQDLSLEAVFQQDLNEGLAKPGESSTLGGSPPISTQYFSAALSGPLASPLYWSAYGTLETGQTLSAEGGGAWAESNVLAFQFSFSLRAYFRETLNSRAEAALLFTSGDVDAGSFATGNAKDAYTLFVPITPQTLGSAAEFKPGNLMRLLASFSIKPFSDSGGELIENLQFYLRALGFFRPTTGALSMGGTDPASTTPYLGFELDGGAAWVPLSDLRLGLTAGVFVPNSGVGGAFLESQRKPEWLVRADASFTF